MNSAPTVAGRAICVVSLLLLLGAALRAQPLDNGLTAGANAEVFTMAIQADGKILVAGNFTTMGGVQRARVARFNTDGTLDAGFAPNVNATIRAIAVQPDGRILLGGSFTSVGTVARTRLVRLQADGSVDPTFNASADNTVRDFAVQPDGRIVAVGSFGQLGGVTRVGVGRLNSDGSVDQTFNPVLTSTNTPLPLFVETVVRQPDGRLLIAGNFAIVNGQSSAGAARLNADGTRDASFNPAANSNVLSILLLPDGKFILGGGFTRLGSETRTNLARFNADGTLDAVAPAPPNGGVIRLARQPDGRVVLGGTFTEVGPVRRNRIARLNTDMSLDPTFAPDVGGSLGLSTPGVYALAATASGQIVIGGSFSTVAGAERLGVARFGSAFAAIVAQPTSLFAPPGANVTLSVSATGESLLYQWRRDGVEIRGATSAVLTLPAVQTAHTGLYTVSVSNGLGTVVSDGARLSLGTPAPASYTVSTVAGSPGQTGLVQATGPNARFNRPLGIAVAPDGALFVMDGPNNVIREIAPHGFAGILAGVAGWGLARDAAGGLYVADADTRIAFVTRNGAVSTYAGSTTRGAADGPRAVAQFRMPRGVTVDRVGNVYVADGDNFTIRKIGTNGFVTTLAGVAGEQGLVDGAGSSARFNSPWGIAADAAGNLYVADRAAVRKVTPAGGVTTIAPQGTVGDAIGVAVDGGGTVFVTDVTGHTIRRILPHGGISVIAGAVGVAGSTDGPGPSARFNAPWNLTADAAGNLFITDNANHTIRKAAPDALPLGILAQPVAQHTEAGASAALTVAATGTGLTYQWKKDGLAVAGATEAAYVVPSASAAHMGYYTVVVASAGSAIESSPVLLTVTTPGMEGRLINVSTRGFVPAGGALTPGFVLRGASAEPKTLLIRGAGPALLAFGVGGALLDPRLDVIPSGATAPTLSNDDWFAGLPTPAAVLSDMATRVGAFPLPPGSKDAAVVAALSIATANAYSVRITPVAASGSGVALAEIYDADPLTSPVQLINISTRGYVGVGAESLAPGFVIGGSGPVQVLIRAVGPGLAPFGVTDLLANPHISLMPQGRDTPIASNDDWGGTTELVAAARAAGAFSLPLTSRDAALLVRLPPGAYTVVVTGVNNTVGNALVEVYDVP